MNDVIERLRAANPVPECDPPSPSVLELAFDAQMPGRRRNALRWMPSLRAASGLAAGLLAVAIFVLALTTLSHPRSQLAPSGQRPAGERSLTSVMGALSRPQTAADRRVIPAVGELANRFLPTQFSGRPDYSTVRIVGPGPNHSRLVLVALRPVSSTAFAHLRAKDRHHLASLFGHWRVALVQVGGRYPSVLLTGETAAQVKTGNAWESGSASKTAWSMVVLVPNGVSRVVARGAGGPRIPLRVHNNVAAAWNLRGKLRWPRTMVWYGAQGNVLARIGPHR
jgi:hypothetical protein